MKFRHLLGTALLAGAAYQGYKTYKNKEELKQVAQDFESGSQKAMDSWQNVQKQAQLILAQKDTLEKLGQDLNYKTRVFQNQTQAHLAEIQRTLGKYQVEEN